MSNHPQGGVGRENLISFVSFSCTHGFMHLFLSVWTHVYSFCTLGYNPLLLYFFVAQIFLALAIGKTFRVASLSLCLFVCF